VPKKLSRKAQHAKLLRDNRKHYEALLRYQRGCAICGRQPKKRRLDMDHDHRTMRIRGLLCVRCNRALPSWMTPEWLADAAQYLRDPPYDQLQLHPKENQ
jgi:hypothetical protein